MKITRREVISSIAIIAIMFVIGMCIRNWSEREQADSDQKYLSALQISDQDTFEYCMKTSAGRAFVYGDLIVVDPVSYDEIDGEYLYVEKVEQHYNQHTRNVAHHNGKQTYYTTEVYYSWDTYETEEKHAEKITFLGITFPYEQIVYPDSQHLTTIKTSHSVRFKYYVVPSKMTGTIFTDLRNNTISEKNHFYQDTTPQEFVERETTHSMVWFWIIWIILTAGITFVYYYIDNDWLEDNR